MQVKKEQLEPEMEQETGSKWGNDYVKAVYCHPAYLTHMQSVPYTTSRPKSGTAAERSHPISEVRGDGREDLLRVRGQGRRTKGTML